MAPSTPEDGALQRLSPLTLAALADSGWWVVAGEEKEGGEGAGASIQAAASPMDWGRGAGCEFVTQPCSQWAAQRGPSQPYFCPGLPTPGFADGQLLVEAGIVPASAAPSAASRSACTPDGRALATCGDVPGPGRFTNGCVLAASSAPWVGGSRLSCSSSSSIGGMAGADAASASDAADDDEWWSSRELRVFAAMGGGAGGAGKYCAVPASSEPSDRICPVSAGVATQQQHQQRGWSLPFGGERQGAAAASAPTCSSEAAMGTYWCVSARCMSDNRVALDVKLADGSRALVPCEAEEEEQQGDSGGGKQRPLLPWERGVADLAGRLPSTFRSGRVSCPPASTVCAEQQQQQDGGHLENGGGGGGCNPAVCAPPYGECSGSGSSSSSTCRCLRLDAYGPMCRRSVIQYPPAPYYRRLRPHGG